MYEKFFIGIRNPPDDLNRQHSFDSSMSIDVEFTTLLSQLGGVVHRTDFQCHVDEHGKYTLAKEYDYPSLAEVSRLLQERKVNLIFAVTEDRRREYELIADLLKEHGRVATLTRNSSNILEIIESSYHDIVSKVVLRDNSTGPLRLEYLSACGGQAGSVSGTSECEGIQEGRVYEFKVVISVDECPRNESLWVSVACPAREPNRLEELICLRAHQRS